MIQGVELKPLRVHSDDRGILMETLRCDDPSFAGFGQATVTMSYPGIIKAFHWHRKQTDVWFIIKGMVQVVLHDLREDSRTFRETQVFYLGDHNRALLLIPPGVAHGYRVLGTESAWLTYYTSLPYNPDDPDEERLAWDDPKIGFDWSTKFR